MAELRDEFGNPIQLTDELGNPVKLTDEHGNPVHITGVATPVGAGGTLKDMFKKDEPVDLFKKDEPVDFFKKEESSAVMSGAALSGGRHPVEKIDKPSSMKTKLDRSSSSSSSSSEEDDGMGGRRKKGLKEKLREKLNLGKEKEKEEGAFAAPVAFPATVPAAKVTTYPAEPLHEKKSMLEKIKEKLPGHHGH
ncbi:embryogenic cell protein 40-like [Impatiens glandulifera]|uniref:embryogenic cell protein 40-like n=1 Tax=Impatiens glandulifera TaxID=253017 RepID=UPI001FB0E435|nr:embryogenic cell protein 40-like [Impatiens glandulifera]